MENKKITFIQFCDRFLCKEGRKYLDPAKIKAFADFLEYKITDIHNIIQDAKDDNRL